MTERFLSVGGVSPWTGLRKNYFSYRKRKKSIYGKLAMEKKTE